MVSHHSHDISVALAILLLKKTIKNKAEYIIIIQGLFFIFKKFPIGLKENLREEDNFSTRDTGTSPMCPLFGGFTVYITATRS